MATSEVVLQQQQQSVSRVSPNHFTASRLLANQRTRTQGYPAQARHGRPHSMVNQAHTNTTMTYKEQMMMSIQQQEVLEGARSSGKQGPDKHHGFVHLQLASSNQQEGAKAEVTHDDQDSDHQHGAKENCTSSSSINNNNNKTIIDNDESSSSFDSVDEERAESAQSPSVEQAKSHVGPMGIFFKVWSLVKVTKSRHNKMKRQNSEDAGQFHFISGDHSTTTSSHAQLAAGAHQTLTSASSGQHHHHQQGGLQRHIPLQDGHFRRAGSQPPPSSHLDRRLQVPQVVAAHQHQTITSNAAAAATTTTAANVCNGLQTTSTGTNSSSSGVSSTTSNTLASNNNTDGNSAHLTSSMSAQLQQTDRRWHDGDGRKSQRPARSSSSSASQQQLQQQQQTGSKAGSGAGAKSWTSRIKRGSSVTPPQSGPESTPSPSASYASRYRFRRADPNLRQVLPASNAAGQRLSSPSVVPSTDNSNSKGSTSTRAQSEVSQLDELRRRAVAVAKSNSPAALISGHKPPKLSLQRLRRRARQDSVSDEGDDRDDDDEARHEEEGDEDSDLNDIYSTPNDSIQSVPSGQFLLDGANLNSTKQQASSSAGGAGAQRQPLTVKPSYQMTKSFSANNFKQISKQQQQQQQMNGKFKQIDEHTQPNEMTANSDHEEGQENSNNNNNSKRYRSAATETSRLNGSRFFISSSSSEDSNPPPQSVATAGQQQQQQQLQQPSHVHLPPVSKAQHQYHIKAEIPLQLGLHYHGQPTLATRPNSLIISPSPNVNLPANAQQQATTGLLLTPSTIIMNGLDPSANIAAMSPMYGPNSIIQATGYKKSPSLFEMSTAAAASSNNSAAPSQLVSRFTSKYPWSQQQQLLQFQQPMSSFVGGGGVGRPSSRFLLQHFHRQANGKPLSAPYQFNVPSSISLHDCKPSSVLVQQQQQQQQKQQQQQSSGDRTTTTRTNDSHIDLSQRKSSVDDLKNNNNNTTKTSEYKLAQMLLELGSNPSAKDEDGCTALMHAIISENMSALKCLLKHGVDLNDVNNDGLSALDLICSKPAYSGPSRLSSSSSMEMLKLLIDNGADLDRARPSDGSRLLDRLIGQHQQQANNDKIPFIDCLLHNGAKLGSSTWVAAQGKHEIQLRLLRKLCQDGYFLYKKSSIEQAVYRFEYALKRIAELERDLINIGGGGSSSSSSEDISRLQAKGHQIKYQTFLGLSRCERKRRFFKRALEFAHMSILVDSVSYEGYYSKAHILKDIGELDDSLMTIDQTERLVNKSIELVKGELFDLQNQEESIVFDGCFYMHDTNRSCWIESSRMELNNNLDYLVEAKRHISRLRDEIMEDKRSR